MIKQEGIDIIVVNHNGKGHLERCIRSIQRNTEGRYNIIVVDQGSTDGSRQWVKHKVNHLIITGKGTIEEAWNIALRSMKYELAVLIDSHAEIRDRDWIDKLWSFTIDRNVGIIEAKVNGERPYFAGFGCCMIRKKVFREIGLFLGSQEDFIIRYQQYGKYKTCYCDDTNIALKTERRERPKEIFDIYTQDHIAKMLFTYDAQRREEEITRGWTK